MNATDLKQNQLLSHHQKSKGRIAMASNSSDAQFKSLLKHFAAGALAGCVSRTATAPLDRLKVFLQVNANHKTPYTIPAAMRYLYNEGGIFSFWRGNGVNVLKLAPESALKFMAYEEAKQLIQRLSGHPHLGISERFLAGAVAGAFAQTVIYPLEVLKTRLALRKTGELNGGVLIFARNIYRKEGLAYLYRGYMANLIGIFPYAGIDLAVYETVKNWWIKLHPHRTDPGVCAILGCGVISSSIGQVCTYPFALIRTRLQARTISSDPNQPATIIGQFKYIYKNEGFFGLYRGIAPNFMKVLPAVSISYVVYEQCRESLGAKMT